MKKWKLWMGMLLIFIAGGVVGAIGTSLVVRHKIVSVIDEGPPAFERLAVQFFSRRLDLSTEQKSQTARIVHDTQENLATIRLRVRPEAIEIISAGMEDIRVLLDSDQQENFDQLYTMMKRRWAKGENMPDTRRHSQ
ncbi:MAG: hypothetical protein K9N10_22670 [Deltaproteobacteria bacterium]|nr:hypothetical protein [Deltaproteobacteria bacterium]